MSNTAHFTAGSIRISPLRALAATAVALTGMATLHGALMPDDFAPVANSSVACLIPQADGKVLAGGGFTKMNGAARTGLARLNPDGSLDAAFDAGLNGSVSCVGVQNDGKILVGGSFTLAGGVSRNRVARLNPDGRLDDSFNPNADNWVSRFALQPDGKILIGGAFTKVGGTAHAYLARLDADGSVDSNFNANANSTVQTLALEPGGRIIAGGYFTLMNGTQRNRLARLNADGSLDDSFNPNANGEVRCLGVRQDGTILAGGAFTSIGGLTRNRFAHLLSDGSPDPGFDPNVSGTVYTFIVARDGRICIGGYFSGAGGAARNNLARLNPDGTADLGFQADTSYSGVTSLALDGGGSLLVGGLFSTIGGASRTYLARLPGELGSAGELTVANSQIDWGHGGGGPEFETVKFEIRSGPTWSPQGQATRVAGGWRLAGLSLPANGAVRALGWVIAGDGNGGRGLIGQTASFGSATTPDIAITGSAGEALSSALGTTDFGSADLGGAATPRSFTVTNVGETALTGLALTIAGGQADDFAITSPPLATTLAPGGGVAVTVTFSPQAAGWRGVTLAATSNDPDEPVFEVNLTGMGVDRTVPDFVPTVASQVRSVALLDGGRILVSQASTSFPVRRLNPDGTLDRSFSEPRLSEAGNTWGQVTCMAPQDDGKILLGGEFYTDSATSQRFWYVARFSASGVLDETFAPVIKSNFGMASAVSSVAIQPDGKVVVAGRFNTVGGVVYNNLCRLLATGATDTAFNPNVNADVRTVAVQTDGKILVGGEFTLLGNTTRNRIARLNADGTLDAAFNPDANGSVVTLVAQPDGKTLIGGDFTTVGGVERNRIARLNADGTPDPGFDPNADGTVQSLALQTNGGVVVGGNFTHLAGAVRLGVALVGGNGVLDPEFQPNVGSDVRCVALRGDGAVFVGGTFAAKDGAWGNGFGLFPRPGSASVSLAVSGTTQLDWQRSGAAPEVEQVFFDSWNGTGWTSLGAASRVTGGWRKTGLSLASATWLRARGRATGGLCNAGASVIDHLNHRAGTMSRIEVRSPTGTRLFTATGSVNFGSRNYWLPGGQTLVLTLTNAGNAPLTGLAASISGTNAGEFTAAALAVTTLAPGASTPLAITFRPTAGGSRSATVSIASSDLLQSPVVISLTGTGMHPLLGTSFLTSYDVRGIAIWPDGSTLIGDDKGLSRLRADGTLDPLITTALGGSYLMALAALRDGSMLIGGSFLSINRVPRKYVARLNPDGTLDSGFISITDLQATAIHPLPDGKVIVGTYNNADPGYVRHNADGSSDGSDGYGTVETIASQPDGRLLVGGKFSFIGGASRNRIARLNVDDTADATFNPNANGEVTCIAVQADGRIIIGGLFTTVGGVTRNRIARLNADGSVDVGFNPDANGSVLAITLQADGKILLGGTFATLGGQERKCLARLNADGSLDPTFNPGASSSVRCIALREDGGILVGGSLTSLGGQRVTGFACLSNNLPATRSLTATGPGQLDWARGGSAPELSRVVFERWDGTGWISLGDGVRVPGGWRWSGPALPAGSRVKASGMTAGAATGWVEQSATIGEGALPKLVVRDAGGAALAAGTTVEFGDQEWLKTGPARVFTLTNAGTATLSGLTVGVGGGHSGDFMVGQPAAITLAPGQSADFSVSFTPQGGEDRNALLTIASNDPDNPAFRLPVHGMGLHRDPWFTPGTNSKVNCLAVQPDGKILVGGTFLSAGGMARYGLARFHPDGSPDLAFNPNGTSSVDSISAWPAIRCLVVQGDGKILVGGEFGKLGGQTRAYLGRLNPDGTLDASFTPTPNGPVSTVVIQADGNILIGGTFTSVSASTHSRLARLAPDGTVDASFNPDANNHVKCIALQPDGKLVVGGDFTTISGKSYSGIARLNADGTVDTSFFSAIGLNTGIASISIQPDGAILMANDGTTTGLPSLRRRDSSGNWDNSLAKSNPDGSITSLATQADGKILIGGKFNWIQAGRRSAVARLNADGTLDPLFAPQATGYSTSVYALAIQPNGDVLIGGEFSRVGGVGRTCLARLPNNTAAIQSLAVTGTDRIDWTRGGGGPEVTAVTFDGWDGSAWVSLGKATRVAGGWSKTGLNLPAQGWLRARGQTTGGQFNGGNSLIEQIAAYGSGGYPALVVETAPGTPMAGGGAALDLGTLVVGASLTKTLTIRNDGTADLTGLAVSLAPNQSSPFTLLPPPVDSLAPGDSTTFTVIFATPTAGTATARLLIESNDLAQAPFEICLAATGVLAPEIGVEQPPGTGLAATGKCDFGMASWSHPTARSFTIRNAGTGPLNLGPAILSGADAGAFKLVITGTRSVVEPGGSTPLLVIFQPFATGPCAAHLSLPNNSTGAPELRLDLTGTGTSATPPALTLQPDGRAALRFWGVPGSAVAVERSTDLAAWFQVTTLTIGPDGTVTYADESPPPPHAFYRFGKR